MRPTLLGFRSPKEKTPDAYLPRVTYDGRFLNFNPSKGDSKSTSFSYEKRFKNYDSDAKRINYRIGPGSYSPENLMIGKEKISGGPLYKNYHGGKKVENNGYYFVGSNLVFDPRLVLKSQKNSIEGLYCDSNSSLSNFSNLPSRPKSSAASVKTDVTHKLLKGKILKQKRYKTPTPRTERQIGKKSPQKLYKKNHRIRKLIEKRFL